MVKPWQVVLATIGIFLAGLVTGGAITLRVVRIIHEKQQEANAKLPGGINLTPGNKQNPTQFGPQLIHRLATSQELNLGPVQRYKINQISQETSEKLVRLRRETALNSLLLIEQMQDDISAILNPQQRAIFEKQLSDKRQEIEDFKQKQQNELKNPAAEGQAAAAH